MSVISEFLNTTPSLLCFISGGHHKIFIRLGICSHFERTTMAQTRTLPLQIWHRPVLVPSYPSAQMGSRGIVVTCDVHLSVQYLDSVESNQFWVCVLGVSKGRFLSKIGMFRFSIWLWPRPPSWNWFPSILPFWQKPSLPTTGNATYPGNWTQDQYTWTDLRNSLRVCDWFVAGSSGGVLSRHYFFVCLSSTIQASKCRSHTIWTVENEPVVLSRRHSCRLDQICGVYTAWKMLKWGYLSHRVPSVSAIMDNNGNWVDRRASSKS
jgi:hypothetical protein